MPWSSWRSTRRCTSLRRRTPKDRRAIGFTASSISTSKRAPRVGDMTDAMSELWSEHLLEKHECMPYGLEHTSTRELGIGGERYALEMPRWLPEVRGLRATVDGDLIFVIGRIE